MSDSRAYKAEPLNRESQPIQVFEFYASTGGNTPFPWDMLRFDRCWPNDGADLSVDKKNIKFRSYNQPTPARWSSFLWTISAYPL